MNYPWSLSTGRLRRYSPVLVVGVLALLAVMASEQLISLENGIGYAVCSQLPAHSFWLNEQPMPLCARCTGQYLGALAGFLGLAVIGRGRAGYLPRRPVLAFLALCAALWAGDGLNSFLAGLPGTPQLYEPSNELRLASGLLMGLSLSLLVAPAFNSTFWADYLPIAPVQRLSELWLWVAVMAALWVGVAGGWQAILYPLAVLSVIGLLLLLTLINTMFWQLLRGRFASVRNWRQAARPLAFGLATTAIEIVVLDAVRGILQAAIG